MYILAKLQTSTILYFTNDHWHEVFKLKGTSTDEIERLHLCTGYEKNRICTKWKTSFLKIRCSKIFSFYCTPFYLCLIWPVMFSYQTFIHVLGKRLQSSVKVDFHPQPLLVKVVHHQWCQFMKTPTQLCSSVAVSLSSDYSCYYVSTEF